MTDSDLRLDYWRALAEARQRELEDLRSRLRSAIDTISDEHMRALITALDVSRPSWIRDLDAMTTAIQLEPSDVLNVLGDLWRRIEADDVR